MKLLRKLEMTWHSQGHWDEGSGEEKGPWATACFCFPHICSLGRNFTSSVMMCWVLHSGSWALDTLGPNWLAFHGLDCSSFKELQGVRSRRWQEMLALHLESQANDLCAGKKLELILREEIPLWRKWDIKSANDMSNQVARSCCPRLNPLQDLKQHGFEIRCQCLKLLPEHLLRAFHGPRFRKRGQVATENQWRSETPAEPRTTSII